MINDENDYPLVNQGIHDYFAGTESYAMRYMEGQLFATDAISFSHLSGSEGLLGDIASKIKQFATWLYNKISGFFKAIFSPQVGFKLVLVEGKKAVAEDAKGYTLKEGAGEEVAKKMEEIVERTKRAHADFIRHLKPALVEKEKKTEFKAAFAALCHESPETYEQHWEAFEKKSEAILERVRNATTVKAFGEGILDFNQAGADYAKWFIEHQPGITATRKNSELSRDAINKALIKGMGNLLHGKDQQQATAFMYSFCSLPIQFVNTIAVNVPSYNGFIHGMGSRRWYEKK